MSQVNDTIEDTLRAQGFSGALPEMIIDWAQANGAISDQYNTAIIEAIQAQGITVSQFNEAWIAFLEGRGYVGALPEMLKSFWEDGGDLILGARFDGTNDNLLRTSDLTGAADGKAGTIAFRLRFNGGDAAAQYLYNAEGNRVYLAKAADNKIKFLATTSGGTGVLNITTERIIVAADGYINGLISYDAAGAVNFYINDVSSLSITQQTDLTIDYSRTEHSIGSTTTGLARLNADFNFFYFNQDTNMDFTIEANRRKFFDAFGNPVYLGAAGEIPTGVAPIIYQAGSYDKWHLNKGTGGGFTVTGALERPLL